MAFQITDCTPINMELLCSGKIHYVQYVIKEAYLKDKSNTILYVTAFFIVLKEIF